MDDLYTIMTWLGGIGLAVLLLIYLPASVMIAKGKRADLPGAAEPHGVGGWLLFLLLSNIVWTPMMVVVGLAYSWSLIDKAVHSGVFALWFLLQVLVLGAVTSYQVFVFGRLINHRSQKVVSQVKGYLTWAWLVWFAPVALNLIFLNVAISSSDIKDLFTSALYCGLLYWYFSSSKRVKNTYTLAATLENQKPSKESKKILNAHKKIAFSDALPELYPQASSRIDEISGSLQSTVTVKDTEVQRIRQRPYSSAKWTEAKKHASGDEVAALALYLRESHDKNGI